MITPAQCRAARAIMNMSQQELADASNVSRPTIADFEISKRTPYERTIRDIREALEKAGVTFIDENEPSMAGGRGVRCLSSE